MRIKAAAFCCSTAARPAGEASTSATTAARSIADLRCQLPTIAPAFTTGSDIPSLNIGSSFLAERATLAGRDGLASSEVHEGLAHRQEVRGEDPRGHAG